MNYINLLHFILFIMTWTRDASTDSLIAHSEKTTWLDSFESCKDGFGGSAIFEHCQPSTCKASNAIGKIANILSNKVEYWINGFVQRSPVVVYEGCYYIKSAAVSKIHSDLGRFNLSDNSVFSCSYKCPGLTEGDFIFLNNEECLCVPITRYEKISGNPRISPAKCDNICPGSSTDICGGQRLTNFTLFSGYMYVDNTDAKQFKKSIGKTCGTNNTGKLIFDFCQKPRQGVCADVTESAVSCTTNELSWFETQMECINQSKVFHTFKETNRCIPDKVFWVGNYAAEKITWGSFNDLTTGADCLKLEVWDDQYTIKASECSKVLQPLCMVKDAKVDGNKSKNPILFGSIGGFVGLFVIGTIIVFLFIRRQKSTISKTLQRQTDYYSEPTVPSTSEERHSLVNVTEEGVYNHLGDTQEKFTTKSSGPVYDVFGHVDIVYDVSITNNRYQENIGDLYDSSRAVEVYDTTHGRVIKTRPESDTYNIVSTR